MDKVSIEQELNDDIVDRWLRQHANDPVDRAALARMKTRVRAKLISASACVEQTEPDMQLPDGKTCGDCVHLRRCQILFQCLPDNTVCDFAPSRFKEGGKTK